MAVHVLSPSIKRMLHDKMYEKRKVAALEVEKLVRTYTNEGNTKEIQDTIALLVNEFTLSPNPNSRKGGLIGLAACAIALGSQKISPHLESLLKPVLVCSRDPDNRIRYFACEALYNIVKVSRSDTLSYFNELFDVLSKLSADQDPNVRNGTDLLDRLLKDIVSEKPVFDMPSFIILLRERLYTKNQFTRRFLVQWLNYVMTIPEIDIIAFLPEFLEALFPILGDTSKEISSMCQLTLGEILALIGNNSGQVDFSNLTNIIIQHCQSEDPLIKETALAWLHRFIALGGAIILPLSSGVLAAILPTLAYEEITLSSPANNSGAAKVIRHKAEEANRSLMDLFTEKYDRYDRTGDSDESNNVSLPLREMVDVFTYYLFFKSTSTRCAVLQWIIHLLSEIPFRIFEKIDDIFEAVIRMICDPADDVVLLTLKCMAEIASSPAGPMKKQNGVGDSSHTLRRAVGSASGKILNIYFSKFIFEMLVLFRSKKDLLESRSSFIIRQICALISPIDVYHAIGKSLDCEETFSDDPVYCAHAVKKFNTILMTSPEMTGLRRSLKDDVSKENCELFRCLYKSWCHSPVATVALCLLTQNYKHCCVLLQKFSDFDLTVEILVELDKLVNLLESPIFSYLRLQLLESCHQKYLVKSMYSLLMLLPQSHSFQTLNHRLNSLPNLSMQADHSGKSCDGDHMKDVNFDELFQHFVTVQDRHSNFKQSKRFQLTKSI